VRGLPLLKGLTKKKRSGVKQTTENNVTKKKLSESKDFAGFFFARTKDFVVHRSCGDYLSLSSSSHAVVYYSK
jgi:hypothetical protein